MKDFHYHYHQILASSIVYYIILFILNNQVHASINTIKSQNDCPEHFLYHKGFCYIIPNNVYSTHEECYVSTCNNLNATLATITMENIHFFRHKMVPTTFRQPIPNVMPDNMFIWIGLYYSTSDNKPHWINHHGLEINSRNSNFNVIKSNPPVTTGKCGAYCGRMNMKTLKWNFDYCNDIQHNDHQHGNPIDKQAFQAQVGGAPIFKCFCQYPKIRKSIDIFHQNDLYNITCEKDGTFAPTIGPYMATSEFFVFVFYILFLVLHSINAFLAKNMELNIVASSSSSSLKGKPFVFKTNFHIFPYINRFKSIPLFLYIGVLNNSSINNKSSIQKIVGNSLLVIFRLLCFVGFLDGLQMVVTYDNMKFPSTLVGVAGVMMGIIQLAAFINQKQMFKIFHKHPYYLNEVMEKYIDVQPRKWKSRAKRNGICTSMFSIYFFINSIFGALGYVVFEGPEGALFRMFGLSGFPIGMLLGWYPFLISALILPCLLVTSVADGHVEQITSMEKEFLALVEIMMMSENTNNDENHQFMKKKKKNNYDEKNVVFYDSITEIEPFHNVENDDGNNTDFRNRKKDDDHNNNSIYTSNINKNSQKDEDIMEQQQKTKKIINNKGNTITKNQDTHNQYQVLVPDKNSMRNDLVISTESSSNLNQNIHKIEEIDLKHVMLMKKTKTLFDPIILIIVILFVVFITIQLLSFLVLMNSQPDVATGFLIQFFLFAYLLYKLAKSLAKVGDRYLQFLGSLKRPNVCRLSNKLFDYPLYLSNRFEDFQIQKKHTFTIFNGVINSTAIQRVFISAMMMLTFTFVPNLLRTFMIANSV